MQWRDAAHAVVRDGLAEFQWIAEESIVLLEDARPPLSEATLQALSPLTDVGMTLSELERDAVQLYGSDVRGWIATVNEDIFQRELVERREFFNRVESSPLTVDQARAVVTFDNRVQVVASAGSGKTSVMIARAAYAVHRGLADPERILLLAFNKAAAAELQTRIHQRFAELNLPVHGIKSFDVPLTRARGDRTCDWAKTPHRSLAGRRPGTHKGLRHRRRASRKVPEVQADVGHVPASLRTFR